MHRLRPSGLSVLLVALALGATTPLAERAMAEKQTKSVQTEATWVSFDPEARTVTAKVSKAGRGNTDQSVRAGREVVWKVQPEGSVLTRTTVSVQGRKAELAEIPEGKTVNIYWVPDPSGEGRFARKIDVVMSQEEWLEKTRDAD